MTRDSNICRLDVNRTTIHGKTPQSGTWWLAHQRTNRCMRKKRLTNACERTWWHLTSGLVTSSPVNNISQWGSDTVYCFKCFPWSTDLSKCPPSYLIGWQSSANLPAVDQLSRLTLAWYLAGAVLARTLALASHLANQRLSREECRFFQEPPSNRDWRLKCQSSVASNSAETYQR